MFRIVTHRKEAVCVAHGCRNNHTSKDRFCGKHRHRYNKCNDIEKYTLQVLKSNSNKRGVEFGLTLRQFRIFCRTTNYIELKGEKAGSASIDRINPKVGYYYYNIHILSLSHNSMKMHRDNSNKRYDDCEVPF